MKQQKGITLVALIITIIVMLILVGVSVTVALDGGLFRTTQSAVDQTQIELEKEQLLSAIIDAMDRYGDIDYAKLRDNLPEEFTESNGIYIGQSRTKYVVDSNGDIAYYKTIRDIIAEINADIAANPSEWEGFDDSEGETRDKLESVYNKYNIGKSADFEDAYITTEGNYLKLIVNSNYYGEMVKISILLEETPNSIMNIKQYGIVDNLETVLAKINKDITDNPTKWSGLDHSKGEMVAKLTNTFNENNIEPTETLDKAEVVTSGNIMTIAINVTYYGDPAKIAIEAIQDTNNLFDVKSFKIIESLEEIIAKSLEEIIAKTNKDIAENPTEWKGLDHSKGETSAKLTSVFNENNIVATETLDKADITTSGNIMTIVIDVTYYNYPVKISIETTQDTTTKLYDVNSFAVVK